jgi:putative membrane protein
MVRMLKGLLAGVCATAPMSLVMSVWHRLLPERERYPLPPAIITTRVARAVGAEQLVDEEAERVELSLLSHFGFGAVAGAAYGLAADLLPLPGAARGAIYGLLVWAAYYLGILPATGLYRPPQAEPLRRHGMMIMAHLVWGITLGLLFGQMTARQRRRQAAVYSGERVSF